MKFLKYLIAGILIVLIPVLTINMLIWRCSHNEDLYYYGNEEYYYVTVRTNVGRNGEHYCGVMKKDEYRKWVEGEVGTVFVYRPDGEERGWRLNISTISSISNYGSEPEWLPLNFKW